MRFFHLADLHIGKKVNGYSMIDDQKIILENIVECIEKEKPEAVVLAGDIYDRRNPPIEAVSLFDRFVSKVILDLHVPIVAIGGNHDGGERLGFANAIQAEAGLHLIGNFLWPIPVVRLMDHEGPVDFYLMSYADLPILHTVVPETMSMDYADAMDWILSHTELDKNARNILVAHGVVIGEEGVETCDSERVLSIGGSESWSSDSLKAFDYVALGHLHQAQRSGSDAIRYAGSLMQYSFSEEKHEKVMLDVSIDGNGDVVVSTIPLKAPRKLVTVQGYLENLLRVPPEIEPHKNDYLRVILEDEGALIEPMQRLKSCYPNIMLLERVNLTHLQNEFFKLDAAQDNKNMSPMELFRSFYQLMMESQPDEEMCAIMREVFEQVQKEKI